MRCNWCAPRPSEPAARAKLCTLIAYHMPLATPSFFRAHERFYETPDKNSALKKISGSCLPAAKRLDPTHPKTSSMSWRRHKKNLRGETDGSLILYRQIMCVQSLQ